MLLRVQKLLDTQSFLDLIEVNPRVIFVFDYDGTLVEIPYNPEDAILSESSLNILNRLVLCNSAERQTRNAILTGRTIANLNSLIQDRLDSSYILYGSHGAEIETELEDQIHSDEILHIKNNFVEEPHIYIEEKPTGITIHYRKHPNRDHLIAKLESLAGQFHNIFRVQKGHQVFEFLPKHIHKGLGIEDLNNRSPGSYLIFFGDDLTDNYAFSEVNRLNGLSVQVGQRLKEQEAGYFINNVAALYELLQAYLEKHEPKH